MHGHETNPNAPTLSASSLYPKFPIVAVCQAPKINSLTLSTEYGSKYISISDWSFDYHSQALVEGNFGYLLPQGSLLLLSLSTVRDD